MCEQCTTAAISFGEPLPGWYLKRARRDGNDWKKGEWGLIRSNDPTFKWSLTPTPSPMWGMTDEEEEAWFEAVDKTSPEYHRGIKLILSKEFDEYEDQFMCDPRTGYMLITAAMERGYDPHASGHIAHWLFDYLGEWLKTAPMEEEGDALPDYGPVDYTIGRD